MGLIGCRAVGTSVASYDTTKRTPQGLLAAFSFIGGRLMKDPYFDVGVTQVKTTPEVGRLVPFSNAVLTAVGQVMVQCPE